MWSAIVLGFLGGVMGGNALPHFVRGITRRSYPCTLGNGPIPNLVAGWVGLVLSVLLLAWAGPDEHPAWTLAAAAAGVLAIGLFHAGPGAFPRAKPGEA
ncbi:hypothetical protein BJF79_14165 [Actinomadura sp. CNU-125]|uniref:hypothetical protein n=1 Tax=Actinomadura sp. CNU-125 TaxID=1904961 RepID=UPI000967BFDB|nr:hypothetical protein [Actinomadura sp. CNU-125]OLT23894.1 hypothetical protein BJF79_14165 [Actinomadura sp. CNU-125]